MSIFMNNATITLDGVDCSDHANNLTATPTSAALTFTGVSGNTVSDAGAETWAVSFAFAQDWDDQASVFNTLYDKSAPDQAARSGELTVFSKPGAGTGWRMDVSYVAPSIGGAGQAAMVATVTMPISGRPRRVTRDATGTVTDPAAPAGQ